MDGTERVPSHTGALRAAWATLITMGVTTMTCNIWHATHEGHLPWPLALLYGFAPVTAALLLSHITGAYQGGGWMKALAALVMLGAMTLSMSATASVVAPTAGPLMKWLFGVVVDGAALVALQVILSPVSKAARKAERDAMASAVPEAAPEAVPEPVVVPGPEPASEPIPVPEPEPRQRPGHVSKEPEAEQARAEYRKSVRRGEPLSDRALGEKFGRSRTWGASRIKEVGDGPRLAASKNERTEAS